MTKAVLVEGRIAELREAFDRTFARPAASQAAEETENLLSIRVAGFPYAIRVSEISGIVNDRKTVALPSRAPELLGVAGIRGGLVPVYSLASLLGYGQDTGQARWLALCGSDEPVALAFSEFEGYVRVPSAQVFADGQKDMPREHAKEVLRTSDMVRAVVNIPHLLEMVKRRCEGSRVSKEQ